MNTQTTNKTITKAFLSKANPKSSITRQKLSGVYDYMLYLFNELSFSGYSTYIFSLPAIMDNECGIFSTLNKRNRTINAIFTEEQNTKKRQQRLLNAGNRDLDKSIALIFAFVFAIIFAINASYLQTSPAITMFFANVGFVIGFTVWNFVHYCLLFPPTTNVVEQFNIMLNEIHNLIENKNDINELFTGESNVIIVKQHHQTGKVFIEFRTISELEKVCPNVSNMNEMHKMFYSKMFVVFKEQIAKLMDKKNIEGFVDTFEFNAIDNEFQNKIKNVVQEVNKYHIEVNDEHKETDDDAPKEISV